jgi:phenylalanyl-tRNA synthetase alpha chain
MQAELDRIVSEALASFAQATESPRLEQDKARFLGKTGSLTELLKALGKLEPSARKEAGAAINAAKSVIEGALDDRRRAIADEALQARLAQETIDVSLPGRGRGRGGIHPVVRTQQRVEAIFRSIGFDIADGPEIETDWYNFTALNIRRVRCRTRSTSTGMTVRASHCCCARIPHRCRCAMRVRIRLRSR